jgi:hypothetical protein
MIDAHPFTCDRACLVPADIQIVALSTPVRFAPVNLEHVVGDDYLASPIAHWLFGMHPIPNCSSHHS